MFDSSSLQTVAAWKVERSDWKRALRSALDLGVVGFDEEFEELGEAN